MADPTPEQIAAAYAMVCQAERAAMVEIKAAADVFTASVAAALEDLPVNQAPTTPGIGNIVGWRNSIQSIATSIDAVLTQYPAPNS